MAAIAALEALKRPCLVDIHTDSQYLRNGIMSWITRWKRNGWRTAENKPVKNVDLWQRLDLLLATHRVRWHWVRGHFGASGDCWLSCNTVFQSNGGKRVVRWRRRVPADSEPGRVWWRSSTRRAPGLDRLQVAGASCAGRVGSCDHEPRWDPPLAGGAGPTSARSRARRW